MQLICHGFGVREAPGIEAPGGVSGAPQGIDHQKDGFVIRRNAIETGVNVLTSLDTAEALVTSLENTDANRLSLIDIATIARR